MIDPRPSVVAARLAGIGRIAAFCSAKGGVGKTLCTTLAGLALAARGKNVGILDLDLQGSTAHLFLGVRPGMPREDKGILPLPVTDLESARGGGLVLMGAGVFAGNRALALRGHEVSDAILELLAVTIWGPLDALLLDLPPGIGEEVMDLARLVPRLQAFVVSTPSAASTAVVERLLAFLSEVKVPVAGVIANMTRGDDSSVRDLASRFDARYAGEVPWEPQVEPALGSAARLGQTAAAAAMDAVLKGAGW
ncbi:MAG TPA: P-loop NTPase [Spirochaetia bacterium]|nr:P-loop NTPase [Spirochaetia bacterium]